MILGDKSPNYVIYGNDALLIHACEPQQQFNGGILFMWSRKELKKNGAYFNKIKLLEKCICLLSDCNAHGFVSNFPLFIFELFS